MSYLNILRQLERDKGARPEPVRSESPDCILSSAFPSVLRPALEPGCLIHWQGMDGKIRGPALLRGTLDHGGQTWGWFVFEGTEYLIDSMLIVKMESDSST